MPSAAHAYATPTFYRDVLPILQRHCQRCHRAGEIGPMPFVTYDQVQPLARAVADSLRQRQMPPWFADPGVGHFSNDPSLSPDENGTIGSWADSNVLQPEILTTHRLRARGSAAGISRGRTSSVRCRNRFPFRRRATSNTPTRSCPPASRREDGSACPKSGPPAARMCITRSCTSVLRIRIGCDTRRRRAVHGLGHDGRTGSSRHAHDEGGHPSRLRAGKFAGQLACRHGEVHSRGFGSCFPDALYDPRPRDHRPDSHRTRFRGAAADAARSHFAIDQQRLRDSAGCGQLSRGSSRFACRMTPCCSAFFRTCICVASDSSTTFSIRMAAAETLLRVNYDFYWQLSYRLAEPRPLPAGTKLQAVAWFDNSKNNPHNPDPTAAVYWGDQTYDEMMVGFFDVAVPADIDKTQFFIRPNAMHDHSN